MIPKQIFAALLLLFTLCASPSNAAPDTSPAKPKTIEEIVGLVNQYCGACHKVPPPDIMPKKNWPFVVETMAELATKRMGREFIPAEAINHITAYYYGSSPESLPMLPRYEDVANPLAFSSSDVAQKSKTPLVVNVKSVQLGAKRGTEFLVCDGERNQVSLLTKKGETWHETVLAEIQVPSHTEAVDYDADGDVDIIVSALGVFPPSDELAGQVLILRQTAPGTFEKELLLEGVGRVSDTRAVDMDGDGDLDLAVAIFGGGVVGGLAWLENVGDGKHIKHTVLKVSGALNVSPADLNGDGKIDLVSLISQEYETVIALINKGDNTFDQVPLIYAPHPMFGSTGMRLVDLDSDGDQDVLFTNGDAYDMQTDPKPYHGVQWLENKGKLKFQFHEIARFYGAATAVAGDLDADGDLDVVAGSWSNFWDDPLRQSLIWFENDGKQHFTRHNISNKPPGIVSVVLEDVTGDGRLDIIAGVFRMDLLLPSITPKQGKEDELMASSPGQDVPNARVILLENSAANTAPVQ